MNNIKVTFTREKLYEEAWRKTTSRSDNVLKIYFTLKFEF